MTADERIEKLLNRFGQTISDLPKAGTSLHAYSWEHLESANLAAWRWHGNQRFGTNQDCEDYICHLCDVIDRMETALETARRWMRCDYCEKLRNDCKVDLNDEEFVCDFRLDDMWLF